MSVAGPLIAIGLATLSAGLFRALTGARLFATAEDWALAALGAAMLAAGFALRANGAG